MMKNSSLLNKWTNNKNNKNNKNSNKNWLHSPEVLQRGHIVYLVKFLGNTEVSQPKGIEVVKEAVRKLRFNQQLKKSEGAKTPKVELTISVDGVAVQQPKSKKILSQYPLHNISYCADDKAEKRFFSFIAKEPDGDVHTCFVFVSDKLAEEITLTIGQAFDLAYRRFLETSSREIDLRRQIASLQSQLRTTQEENQQLRDKLGKDGKTRDQESPNLIHMNGDSPSLTFTNGSIPNLPPVPPRNNAKNEIIIEALLNSPPNNMNDDFDFDPRAEEKSPNETNNLDEDDDFEDDFDPRAEEENGNGKNFTSFEIRKETNMDLNGLSLVPSLLPPPPPSRNQNVVNNGTSPTNDPFALQSNGDLLDQFNEMKMGFNRGISFGTTDDDFTLESLDPLKN